jgi:hypothetical protein
MSRSRRKSIAAEEEDDQGTVLTSELPNKSIESAQLVTGPDSEQMCLTIEQSQDLPEPESDMDRVESMQPDSLAARWPLEHRSVLRELHRAVVRHMIFYTKPEGGGLSMEEAMQNATRIMEGLKQRCSTKI